MLARWLVLVAAYKGASASIVITEVADKGDPGSTSSVGLVDFIELYNPSTSPIDITGYILTDDNGHGYHRQFVLGTDNPSCAAPPTSIPAQSYIVYSKGTGSASNVIVGGVEYPGCGFEFGVGDNDIVTLHASVS